MMCRYPHFYAQVLELSYVDGGRFRFSSELLRVLSPSADSRRTDARGAISRVSEPPLLVPT